MQRTCHSWLLVLENHLKDCKNSLREQTPKGLLSVIIAKEKPDAQGFVLSFSEVATDSGDCLCYTVY